MEPGKDYPISWGGSPATPGMTTEEQYIFDLSGVRPPTSDASRFIFAMEFRSTVLPCQPCVLLDPVSL